MKAVGGEGASGGVGECLAAFLRLEGRPRWAPVFLAAIAYNFVLNTASFVVDVGYSASELIPYIFGGAIIASISSCVISVIMDYRLNAAGCISWRMMLGLSLVFAIIGAPAEWLMRPEKVGYQLQFSSFAFLISIAVNMTMIYAVWSILHLCIRSAERAIAQERRAAALREAMLRYENQALSCTLDSGFFMDALMRITWALKDGAGVLAGEIVMSLAERMRAALAPSDSMHEAPIDEAFAGAMSHAQSRDLTGSGLRRLLLIGALGVWVAFCCAFSTMEIVDGRLWWKSLSDYGGQSIAGALWFVFSGRILLNLTVWRVQIFWLITFVTCVLGVCVCVIFLFLSFALRNDLAWPPLVRWVFGFELNCVAPIFIGWGAVHVLIDARRREIARLNAAAEIREAALSARNAMLRLQLNPHFLFNTLNALYVLILDRQFERARGMIAAVRRFLDRAGDPAAGELVALSSELATQDAYLEIERVRFGDRLRVERSIDAEVAGAKVPHLILQPLVENAVKYAVARADRPVAVEIRARRTGRELVLAVADTGAPGAASAPPGLGVGLRNVEARLKGFYGESGRLACRPLEPAGFLAEVRLPLSL